MGARAGHTFRMSAGRSLGGSPPNAGPMIHVGRFSRVYSRYILRAQSSKRPGSVASGAKIGIATMVARQHIEVAQQRAAPGKDDSLVEDVGGRLRRRALQRDADRFHGLVNRLHQRFPDLFVS